MPNEMIPFVYVTDGDGGRTKQFENHLSKFYQLMNLAY